MGFWICIRWKYGTVVWFIFLLWDEYPCVCVCVHVCMFECFCPCDLINVWLTGRLSLAWSAAKIACLSLPLDRASHCPYSAPHWPGSAKNLVSLSYNLPPEKDLGQCFMWNTWNFHYAAQKWLIYLLEFKIASWRQIYTCRKIYRDLNQSLWVCNLAGWVLSVHVLFQCRHSVMFRDGLTAQKNSNLLWSTTPIMWIISLRCAWCIISDFFFSYDYFFLYHKHCDVKLFLGLARYGWLDIHYTVY